jgi:hypothetical protein
MTLPTGTSPASAAARASARAISMKESVTLVLAVKLCYRSAPIASIRLDNPQPTR